MSRRADKRRFPRRAKSIRVWFEHAGEQHRAVTTIVGLGGAFFKASHLPRPGTILTMHERFKADGGAVSLRCEVVWLLDHPTLERPDTGFGVRFLEAVTRADPSGLEEFLSGLSTDARTFEITLEERAHGAYSVYRFPDDEAIPAHGDDTDFAEHDELAVIDLHRELDRLGREEHRTPVPQLAPLPEPIPRTRKKRRITGLFTALFSRQREDPKNDVSPEIELIWDDTVTTARLEAIGQHGAAVLAPSAPPEGAQLVLRPTNAPAPLNDLFMLAQLDRRQPRPDGLLSLSLDFVRIDEGGQPGRFLEYLRHINGPR